MTPRQFQIARRWHHELAGRGPRERVGVEAAELRAVLDALFNAVDRANAAEDKLADRRGLPRPQRQLRVFEPSTPA